MEYTQRLVKDIFESSVEEIRHKVRDRHMYGAELNKAELTVLGHKPENWNSTFQNFLLERFLKECDLSEQVIGNREELIELFDELIRKPLE